MATARVQAGWRVAIAAASLWAGAVSAHGISTRPANDDERKALGAPRPLKAEVFSDRHGEQAFVLRRVTDRVRDPDMDEDTDRITLSAQLYARASSESVWTPSWTWTSQKTCPDLDLAADFFLEQSRVLDVDGDGQAEPLIATYVSCGGGVDPKAITIVLHQNGRDIEGGGESLLVMPGEAPAGGKFEPGQGWQQAPEAVQRVIRETFEAVKHDKPSSKSP